MGTETKHYYDFLHPSQIIPCCGVDPPQLQGLTLSYVCYCVELYSLCVWM